MANTEKDVVLVITNTFDERIVEVYGPYTYNEALSSLLKRKQADMDAAKSGDDLFKNATISSYSGGYSIDWGDDTYTDVQIQSLQREKILNKPAVPTSVPTNAEYYLDEFTKTLRDAYISKYTKVLEEYSEETNFKGPFKEWHDIMYDIYSDPDEIARELVTITTHKEWTENPLVQTLHHLFYDGLGIDDGTLAEEESSFSIDDEVGYWLYYYGDVESAIEAMDNEVISETYNTEKAREILEELRDKEEDMER